LANTKRPENFEKRRLGIQYMVAYLVRVQNDQYGFDYGFYQQGRFLSIEKKGCMVPNNPIQPYLPPVISATQLRAAATVGNPMVLVRTMIAWHISSGIAPASTALFA
jgi:hypothetical protein